MNPERSIMSSISWLRSIASGLINASVVSTIICGKPSSSTPLFGSFGCASGLALSMSKHTQNQKKMPKNLAHTQHKFSDPCGLYAPDETIPVAKYRGIIIDHIRGINKQNIEMPSCGHLLRWFSVQYSLQRILWT